MKKDEEILKDEKQDLDNQIEKSPNKEKPYVIRNFFKELKRISWPTGKKKYKYFFFIFVFIIFLIGLFALISWGATELIKLIGAK